MNRIKEFYRKYLRNSTGMCAGLALLINLIIETLARQSAYGGILFLIQSPLVFLYNSLIIFATLLLSILFSKRTFVLVIVSSIWIGLGITNGVILSKRMTPFTVYDLSSFKEGLSIASNYFSVAQMVLIVACFAAAAVGIIVLWRKSARREIRTRYKKNIAIFLAVILAVFGTSGLFIKAGILDTYFPNLAYGYQDNGFPYCFINTWLNTGVSKPANYSKKEIRSIFTKKELETTVAAKGKDGNEEHPNIIFLQMESFMDPETIKGLKLSEDPIPNFRKLMKETSSGRFTSPAVGAGTANVEFESMTGMRVKFFGPGEYPYKSILGKEVCESIPYDLESIGYSTHAIHDHRATFYNRNTVFKNLGFQTFTSLEYMNNVSTTPKNWAKDFVLTDQIEDALKSTKGSDYIYTISVEGHGSYPTEKVIENPKITVEKAASEELKWEWEYYVNQLYEMDEFIGQFINEMKNFDEDTVVVIYGDHLPAISDISDDTLKYGRSEYQTDYVIWSNFKMKKTHEDLAAYQISSEVLNRLGIHQGTMVTYHQKYRHSKNYMKNLEALEYDILYGKRYIYDDGGKTPFTATKMKMGVKDIKIDKIVKIGDKYYIKGENFTEYSKITMDGKILKTIYLGPTILGLQEDVDPDSVSKMKVSQVDKQDKDILSTSE